MPYEKKLELNTPIKKVSPNFSALRRENSDVYRGMENISQNEDPETPIENRETEQAPWGQTDFWKIPEKKPVTPPVPIKNLVQNISPSPREIPTESRDAERISQGKLEPVKSTDKKIITPPVPTKTLPQKPPTKPSPWRLPDFPPKQPKNVVDLKNIKQ